MDEEMADRPEAIPRADKGNPAHLQRIVIRTPEYSYSHLKMIFDPPQSSLGEIDIITWRTLLTNSLLQYLGVVGSGIHIDILHLQNDEAWLRIPSADIAKFGAAVSGYIGKSDGRSVGFKTMGTGPFLMALIGRDREGDVWG